MNILIKSIICSLVLFHASLCVGQGFGGLIPGKSTRVEVEKSLGRPIKEVSATLIEYSVPQAGIKLAADAAGRVQMYIQYRPDGKVVERVALVLKAPDPFTLLQEANKFDTNMNAYPDAQVLVDKSGKPFLVKYIGAPHFSVQTLSQYPGEAQLRLEYYSPELYASTVPRGGCTGTFVGTWATSRGRMTVTVAPDQTGLMVTYKDSRRLIGTFADGAGSFVAEADNLSMRGTWKDASGSGDFSLTLEKRIEHLDNKDFKGTWRSKAGNSADWTGQCVQATGVR